MLRREAFFKKREFARHEWWGTAGADEILSKAGKEAEGSHRREPWQVKLWGEIKTSPCSQVTPQALKEKASPYSISPQYYPNSKFPLSNSPGLVLFAVSWATCTGCFLSPKPPWAASPCCWVIVLSALHTDRVQGDDICKPFDFHRSVFLLTLQLLSIQWCVFACWPTPPWRLFPEVEHFRLFLPWSFLCKTED